MQLLLKGDGEQAPEWHVNQEKAAGFVRIYYIKSGEVKYCDDYEEGYLMKGSMYVFPSVKPYNIEHNPQEPINCLWFHIDIFPFEVERLIEFDICEDENYTIKMILNALNNEYGKSKEKNELYNALTMALTQAIIRNQMVKRPDDYFVEILEFMRNNISSQGLKVKTVSKKFGYSEAHFIRLFNLIMKTSPHRYITNLRLSAAAKLLLDGMRVAEVSTQCGYCDAKNFYKAFKKHYGIAPSEYAAYYKIQA